MKKWSNYVILAVILLTLRYGISVFERNVDRKVDDLKNSGKLDSRLYSRVSPRPPAPEPLQDLYVSEKYPFSVQFPPGWTIKKGLSSDLPIDIKALYKPDPESAPTLLATIIVYTYETSDLRFKRAFPNFTSFSELGADRLRRGLFPEHSIISSGEILIAGGRAIWMTSNNRGIFHSLTYSLFHRSTLYVLHCNSGWGNLEFFQKYEPTFRASLLTFRFTD